jgi:Transcriptional regulator
MSQTRTAGSLRDRKREEIREKILSAVAALLAEHPDDDVSFDQVAASSGVSRRTVLNYFPEKEALFRAFWDWANERLDLHQWPQRPEELATLPLETFAAFDRIEGIVRAIQSARSGREMRLMVNDDRRRAYLAAMPEAPFGADPARHRQAAAIAQVLSSPHVWIALKDYWDMDGAEAGEAVSWAIGQLLGTNDFNKGKDDNDT